MQIELLGVVGAGTMGSQIALQAALSGIRVVLCDSKSTQLERAGQTIRRLMRRRVDNGKMTQAEMDAALAQLSTTVDLSAGVAPADFVIEAIVESLDAKIDLFRQLDQICAETAVLASNSSTIGISQLVAGLRRPERCVNMHFFHPVTVMRLVEIMRGPDTSNDTVARTKDLARRLCKEPVCIEREVYGLIVNRILGAIKREAFWLVEEGYATVEDVDRAVKLGLNHPMGPFELSDFSGLDVFYYASLQRMHETGDEQFRPAKILEDKVLAGHLGRKSGKGFYDYDGGTE